MASHYEIFCPHCHGNVRRGGGLRSPRYYGSPIRVCQYCKKSYVDTSFDEMAFNDRDKVLKKESRIFSEQLSDSENYAMEYDASLERLKDPVYIAVLIHAGIKVPDKYREIAEPILQKFAEMDHAKEKKIAEMNRIAEKNRPKSIMEKWAFALGRKLKHH